MILYLSVYFYIRYDLFQDEYCFTVLHFVGTKIWGKWLKKYKSNFWYILVRISIASFAVCHFVICENFIFIK